MLEDYMKDLTATLQQRRDADNAAVIAAGGDLLRGKVQAYDTAIRDAKALFESYLAPEEGPPAIQEWKRNERAGLAGRRFGARRAS